MLSCCLPLYRKGEPPTCLQPPSLAHPTAKDAAAVRGVTCVPEEGSTAPRGLALPQPELEPPQLRCSSLQGQEDGGTRAVLGCRSCRGPRLAGVTPAQTGSKPVCSCHKLDQRQDLLRCKSLYGSLPHTELVGLAA